MPVPTYTLNRFILEEQRQHPEARQCVPFIVGSRKEVELYEEIVGRH